MNIILTKYSDLEKIANSNVQLDIHLYLNVEIMGDFSRCSVMQGLNKNGYSFVTNARKQIQFGTYELVLQTAETELTKKYRERFDWFDYHLMMKVEGRTGLYFHIGNDWYESDGCELIGLFATSTIGKSVEHGDKGELICRALSSAVAYEQFYKTIRPWLDDDDKKVYIHIV